LNTHKQKWGVIVIRGAHDPKMFGAIIPTSANPSHYLTNLLDLSCHIIYHYYINGW